MIEVSQVSHSIAGTSILKDVSLKLQRGGVIALVGPNGAGKSTLLSLIARLQPIQTGAISIEGQLLSDCDTREMAKTLAILPQQVDAGSRLSVRDLVGFGRYPYHRGRPSEKDHALVQDALDLFELNGFADRQLETLSGGQRQRAFVAMAYSQDTDFLLLDEPLNNLDLAASRSLMQRLLKLADQKGRTIIIVLHDINFATAYADRVVVMKSGCIVADGTPIEIVTSDMLQQVFETPAEVRVIDGRPIVMV